MFLCEVGNLMLVVMRSLVKLQWVSQLKGKTRLALPRATSFFNGTGCESVMPRPRPLPPVAGCYPISDGGKISLSRRARSSVWTPVNQGEAGKILVRSLQITADTD